MNESKVYEPEYLYVLSDITKEAKERNDEGKKPVSMPEALAISMNYSRGLNNSPFRWVKQ